MFLTLYCVCAPPAHDHSTASVRPHASEARNALSQATWPVNLAVAKRACLSPCVSATKQGGRSQPSAAAKPARQPVSLCACQPAAAMDPMDVPMIEEDYQEESVVTNSFSADRTRGAALARCLRTGWLAGHGR